VELFIHSPYTPSRYTIRHKDNITFTVITERTYFMFHFKIIYYDFFIGAVGGCVTSAMTADVPCLCSEHVFSVFHKLSDCKMVAVTS
jgi:hypothetical protein